MDIIVQASTDKASKNLRALTGDVDDLGDEVERTNKRMAGLGKGFKVGLAAAAGAAAVGVAAVGAVMVSSVKAGADAQEMLSKFNVVFDDTAGTAEKVTKELDSFARQSGRNKYVLREMASGFGDVLKPLGFSVTEAGDLATNMTQLAVDLGSFNNMKPEEAFERLSSTLIGNHANALAFGVVINESILKEELAAMGADELTGALLEQAKVQARINLLLRGTSDAQGDAIATSGSWTNQMLRLNSIMQETRTEIGLKLLPVLSPFLEVLGDIASEYAPKAADALANMIDRIDVAQLKADIQAFADGLLEGDIILPKFKIEFEAISGSKWISFNDDGTVEFDFEPTSKRTVSIGDIFQFKNLSNETGDAFNLFRLFGIESQNLTIDGVDVKQKAKIGALFEGDWSAEEGFTTFRIGNVDLADTEALKTSIQTALDSVNLFGGDSTQIKGAADGFAASLSANIAAIEWTPPSWLDFSTSTSRPDWWKFDDVFRPDWWMFDDVLSPGWWHFGDTTAPTWWTLDSLTWPEFPDFIWPALPEAPEWVTALLGDIELKLAEFEWSDFIPDSLDWSTFIPTTLSWSTFIPTKLAWSTFIPTKLSWGKFVSDINWSSLISPFSFGGGGESTPADEPNFTEDSVAGPMATGTSFFPGGRTWVGETGPELVSLPRGSQIFPSGQSAQMAAAGMGSVTVNVNATVNNEHDAHVLAQQVADILRRRAA